MTRTENVADDDVKYITIDDEDPEKNRYPKCPKCGEPLKVSIKFGVNK